MTFESTQTAEAAGLFERGWLPRVLPVDAGPIQDVHDIDTNARCSRSEFPARRFDEIETALQSDGFFLHSGRLGELPFPDCPFSLADTAKATVTYNRDSPFGTEFAALDGQGVLYFWAGGR